MSGEERGNISYHPTDGLSYDPTSPTYWDEAALGKELTRTFEVCHGCRMCFKYCDAFPRLFSLIDEHHGGDVRQVSPAETRQVMDDCFQCKLCEVQCPYTPRDGHAFQLDFPKLVHRYQALRTKKEGIRFRDRLLGDPDATAKKARASFGLANVMNRVSAHRWLMEKALGIHRHKRLPDFASKTFEAWASATERIKPPGGEAVLFQTCYVQHNEPQIGRDTVDVLEHNGVDVRCAKGLQCCGMPAWEHGDLDTLRQRAAVNLALLEPYVDAGAKVVVINPTCSMMLRREYQELVLPEDRARAAKVASAVADTGEFVWSLRKDGRFKEDFASSPGDSIAYHTPCHLRAQAVGFRGRDLLKKLPGVKRVSSVMECCGHDGTYAMKVGGFEASQRIGAKAFEEMKAPEGAVWSTECPLAALQFEQHAGTKPLHPMTILAKAYRGDSFDSRGDEGRSAPGGEP